MGAALFVAVGTCASVSPISSFVIRKLRTGSCSRARPRNTPLSTCMSPQRPFATLKKALQPCETLNNTLQGLYMLTNPQRLWVEMQQIVLNLKPARKPRPYFQNQFCIRMFHIVQHHAFECAVVLTIVLNVFLMCLDHHEMSAAFEKVWRYGNLSFCVIYTAEAICKICGYGPNYFRNNWDRFDFTLMALGWGDIIGDFDGALNPNVLRAFRTTRILRVARLLRKSRRIRVLIHTLWCVMPVVSNIACFMLFLFMIYSVLVCLHSCRHSILHFPSPCGLPPSLSLPPSLHRLPQSGSLLLRLGKQGRSPGSNGGCHTLRIGPPVTHNVASGLLWL